MSTGASVPVDVRASHSEWMIHGLCNAYPDDWWNNELMGTYVDEARAKAVCADCPALIHCAAYGMAITAQLVDNRQATHDYGIIGGKTPRERQEQLRTSRLARGELGSST